MLMSQKEFDAHNRVANRSGLPKCYCPDCKDFETYEEEMLEADQLQAAQAECKHNWVEVDAEPPYDVCNSCGAVQQ